MGLMGLLGLLMGLLLLVFADVYFHSDEGVVFGEVDDVFVAHSDAAFAGASRNAVVVACAAVDADTGPFEIAGETQEPFAVGGHIAASVAEVVFPVGGFIYLADDEVLFVVAFRRPEVTAFLFVAVVGTEAYGVSCNESNAGATCFVYVECSILFRDVDEEVVLVIDIGIDSAVEDGGLLAPDAVEDVGRGTVAKSGSGNEEKRQYESMLQSHLKVRAKTKTKKGF